MESILSTNNCIAAGVDTLELGFAISSYKLSEKEWQHLTEAKESARNTLFEKGATVDFHNHKFEVKRVGAQRYNYILENGDITMRISEKADNGKHFPELHIIFRSQYLWRNGWQSAASKTIDWVSTWADLSEVQVSRCDLTADFSFSIPIIDNISKQLITRAKNNERHIDPAYAEFSNGNTINGYSIGKNPKCRIYDKLYEIKKSKKEWFFSIWEKNGWSKGQPVTRVEYQIRRKFLREFQTNSIADLVFQIPDLWRYLTDKWLTIREVGKDTHRHRWPICQEWIEVQKATESFGELTGVVKIKQMQPIHAHLITMIRGCLVSDVALNAESLHSGTIENPKRLAVNIINRLLEDKSFDADVRKRLAKFHTMDKQ